MTYPDYNTRGSFNTKISRILSPLLILILISISSMAHAQQKQAEHLKRGLIAANNGDGFYLSWRLLGNEGYNTGFNVYRGSEKLNDEPITGTTQYVDEKVDQFENYTVRAVVDGVEQPVSEFARVFPYTEGENAAYFDIPLNQPAPGEHGGSYTPNDLSVGDLNGNGEYEVIVKWNPSNAKDNAHSGITDDVYLDAYTLEGTMLWRIDLGPNIRAGAHYTQFMVYDFNGNGKAELMVKTAPGTRDGTGQYINSGPASEADHNAIYRNSNGYILDGPEYLSVFDGPSGVEIDTKYYIPARGNVNDWGDGYGNRVDRFLAGVAYLDGERPSAIFARGYYTRMTVASWDLEDGELKHRWLFDTDDPEYGSEWTSQGNHQLSIIDADNDNKQEIVYGSVVIDDDGTGLHTTGLGHGDALHATYMEKDVNVPYIFMPHEEDEPGVSLRRADTGAMIFRKDKSGDIGRGAAAHLDTDYPGFQFWASGGLGLYDVSGSRVGGIPGSINHVVWWDGALSRELLDGSEVTKWNVSSSEGELLLRARGLSNNGTKANPGLQADLFGDWREQILLRTPGNNLRVYTTTMPTEHRLYTFMHDPTYRVAIAWQNSGYNQPPHPGFYVAGDMDFPLPMPDVTIIDNEYTSCAATHLFPEMTVGNGTPEEKSGALVETGETVTLSPTAESDGDWIWRGPGNFTQNTREITLENIDEDKDGIYTATFINSCGTTNRLSFSIALIRNYWGFEDGTSQGWSVNEDLGEITLAKSINYEGFFSVKLSSYFTADSVSLDFIDPRGNSFVKAGDWINYQVYIPDSEAASISEIGVYHRHGQNWDSADHVWEEQTYTIEDLETDAWNTLSGKLAEQFHSDSLLVMGLIVRAPSASDQPGIYIDNITFTQALPTGIIPENDEIPPKISLGANYPNPFNPTTQIPFSLTKAEDVTIGIYDITGRKTHNIVENKSFQAGTHSVIFDASELSSGIYFYRMSAGEFDQTRKLSLIK